MKEVTIAGGTGLIGSNLSKMLVEKGYKVNIFSKSKHQNAEPLLHYYQWDVDKKQIPVEVLCRADYVVNLAGADIGERRWTEAYKKEILSSRLNSTSLLVETLNSREHKVKAF